MYIVTLHQNPDYPTQIGKKKGSPSCPLEGTLSHRSWGTWLEFTLINQNLLVVGQDSGDGEGVGRTVIAM